MTNKPLAAALVWFRRDLRCDDHAALYHALTAARRVWCAFVFDRAILDSLPRSDRRVEYIHDSVAALDGDLRALAARHGAAGAGLIVRHGNAIEEVARLAQALQVQAVYSNHDDDPAALARDARVRGKLADAGIALHTSKDHVIFERSELLTASGKPYGVFTPYKSAWLKKLTPFHLSAYPIERHAAALAAVPEAAAAPLPTLESLGFVRTDLHALGLAARWPKTSGRASSITARRATSPRRKARAICRWRCASARSRFAVWPTARTSACNSVRAARRPGCRS
jgi:deoxyribodipyrimidine photo-lyase